jgi:anti-sigma B factor antagonist
MEIGIEKTNGVVIIALQGEVDTTTAADLNAAFDELVIRGEQNYVIDLNRVTFMDSSGLAALARMYKRIRIGKGDVRLCCPPSDMRRILELTRFDRVFDIFFDRASAIASFSDSGDGLSA